MSIFTRVVFLDRKMRHHLSCPDYNVPWVKKIQKQNITNGQQELALVSKQPSITLKNVEWCQANQEANELDNSHRKFTLSSTRWEVEGPLETENNTKLWNLSSLQSSSENYTKTQSLGRKRLKEIIITICFQPRDKPYNTTLPAADPI